MKIFAFLKKFDWKTILKTLGKTVWFLACIAVIVCSVFAVIDLVKKYTAKSNIYGTIDYESKEAQGVYSYDFGKNVAFFPNGTGKDKTFVLTATDEHKDFDGSHGEYKLFLNGYPCDTDKVSAGLVSARFVQQYYAADGSVAATVNIDVTISFFSDRTSISLTSKDSASAIGYFVKWTDEKGLLLSVKDYAPLTVNTGVTE